MLSVNTSADSGLRSGSSDSTPSGSNEPSGPGVSTSSPSSIRTFGSQDPLNYGLVPACTAATCDVWITSREELLQVNGVGEFKIDPLDPKRILRNQKKYCLRNSIDLANQPLAITKKQNDLSLNGCGHSLMNIKSDGRPLFRQIANSTIQNIILDGIAVDRPLLDHQTIYENASGENDLYFGVLVGFATNSRLSHIQIKNISQFRLYKGPNPPAKESICGVLAGVINLQHDTMVHPSGITSGTSTSYISDVEIAANGISVEGCKNLEPLRDELLFLASAYRRPIRCMFPIFNFLLPKFRYQPLDPQVVL